MMPSVSIQFGLEPSTQDYLPCLSDFQLWADAASELHSELGVRIVGVAECVKLNQKYRRVNYPSNVLAFPFDSAMTSEQSYLGDIVMTASLIEKEAQEQKKPIQNHWAHLFIHGLLHLSGYQHNTPQQAKQMEAQESKIMKKLRFPDPWNESWGGHNTR